ncbi:MAG: hypothetical protein ACYDDN_03730 [Candidatus Desulforudaceae bacterium]|nr:hypothetical protein [Clostridia bacterium]
MPTIEDAQKLVAENPIISGAELGRRLGVSKVMGNRYLKQIREIGTKQAIAENFRPDPKRRWKSRPKEVQVKQAQAREGVARRQINVIEQLQEANGRVWEIIDALAPKRGEDGRITEIPNGRAETIFKGLAEVRNQLDLQAKLIQMLHDAQAVQEFQEEVLAVISEVEPRAAKEIRRRLAERRSLRTATRVTG